MKVEVFCLKVAIPLFASEVGAKAIRIQRKSDEEHHSLLSEIIWTHGSKAAFAVGAVEKPLVGGIAYTPPSRQGG